MKKNNNAQLICQLSAVAAMMLAGNVHAADAFSADSEWMTGDWGGERTKLIEQGIDFKMDYAGEIGSNLHGGFDDDRPLATPTSLAWAPRWTCRNSSAGTTPSQDPAHQP